MDAQERVTELTQKMLRRKLYAIFGKTGSFARKTDATIARASRIPDWSGKARAIICVRPFEGGRCGTARWRRVDCP
jgi:hypothetical protein